MSNAVVQSAQQLSLAQKRLVMLAVTKLNPRAQSLPEKPLKITAADYGETFGVSMKDAYNELKAAADGVLARAIVRHRPGAKGEIVEKYAWLSRADYAVGEGWVGIKFNPEIGPHLVSLKARFTSYHLEQAGALRSVYSWRMLEHFEMYARSGQGFWQIDINEFHAIMETPASYRANYAQTRRFVLEPAVAELSAKDGWSIDWCAVKRGRKVATLRFDFKKHPSSRNGTSPHLATIASRDVEPDMPAMPE